MFTISIEEAQTRLPELVDGLQSGEEVIITRHDQPVARLIGETKPIGQSRQLGTLQGTVLYMAPDFDSPLEEFREYME